MEHGIAFSCNTAGISGDDLRYRDVFSHQGDLFNAMRAVSQNVPGFPIR